MYPEGTAVAFELAGRLGYDGVEVMVWTDPVSQDPYALQRLCQHYQVPILAIHAPCLIITQRVWTTDPWTKLQKAQFAAELARRADRRGAPAVPLAARLRPAVPRGRAPAGRARPTSASPSRTCSRCGVRGREVSAYQPSWDVADGEPYRDYTLDLSHSAVSHSDSLAMLDAMG